MNENTTQPKEIDLIALATDVWKKRKKVIKWAALGLLVGVIVAFSIPKQYTSNMRITPESQTKQLGGSASALASMIGIGTATNYDGINERIYPEIISSTPFLLEFAPIEVQYKKHKMPLSEYILKNTKHPWWSHVMSFPGKVVGWILSIGKTDPDTLTIENSPAIQYAFTGTMAANITAEMDSKLGIIDIKATFQDPVITKLISDSVVVKLQRYMSEYHTSKTRHTLEMTSKMLEQVKAQYYAADEAYAKALDRNQNLVSRSAEVALDRLRNERNLAYQVYSQLAQQVEATRVKLQEETPVATIIEPATTPIRPSAPRTVIIIIAWTFIGGLIATLTIIVKTLLKKQ